MNAPLKLPKLRFQRFKVVALKINPIGHVGSGTLVRTWNDLEQRIQWNTIPLL
jgi:hypothetical protein